MNVQSEKYNGSIPTINIGNKYHSLLTFSLYKFNLIDRLQSRIADLELLNNNFMASKSDKPTQPMSTVNVAYIRNVLTKLLETKDKEQKQIMINALLTALKSIG